MAISWKKKIISTNEAGNRTETWVDDGVTHVGLVIGTPYTSTTRVMSDIYSDETYVHVLNPDTLTIDTVHLGGAFECNGRSGRSEIDVSPELLARFDAEQAKRAKAAQEAARVAREARLVKEAEQARKAPTLGRMVQVVRGRKVPKGTIGWVFWSRDGRLGLALSEKRDPKTNRRTEVAWVNAAHCEALSEGNTEAEVQGRLDADREAFDTFRERERKAVENQRARPVNDRAPF